jgi:hypothetical protein
VRRASSSIVIRSVVVSSMKVGANCTFVYVSSFGGT